MIRPFDRTSFIRKVRCSRERPGIISALNVTCISGRAQALAFSTGEGFDGFFRENNPILFVAFDLFLMFDLSNRGMDPFFSFVFSDLPGRRRGGFSYRSKYSFVSTLFLRSGHERIISEKR